MPALSPTMEKGNIASWKKKEGEKVGMADVLAEVETDKATVAFESVEEGYLGKILVPEGTNDIAVGTPVAILTETEEDVAKFKDYSVDKASSPSEPKMAGATENKSENKPDKTAENSIQTEQEKQSTESKDRVFISPAARKAAEEKGLDINALKGTGPNDRIILADVNEAKQQEPQQAAQQQKQQQQSQPQQPKSPSAPSTGDYIDIPHTNMRKVIAQRLLQSKTTIPHYYLTSEIKVDQLLKLRSQLNKKSELSGIKLSVNDFITKAAALACRQVPQANSSWLDNAIRQYEYVDVCVAVSTDNGLVTPIVKDADIKGLHAISSDTKQLAKKARENKLQPHEYQGGTFTVSNLGMFGTTQFSAIINPPQAAILAVGTTVERVVQNTDLTTSATQPFITAQYLTVTLSCDHRVVDGAVGAQWLTAFKGYLEDPVTMLL